MKKRILLISSIVSVLLVAVTSAIVPSIPRDCGEMAELNLRGTVRRIQSTTPDTIPLLPKLNVRSSAKKVI